MFTKGCLESLKTKIDLVEVLSPYLELKRAGATYKALCPFHNEKSPSFVVQRGDSHYHCFGCSAHGDAIAFIMHHLKLSFTEAVEMLAEKFGVPLEYQDGKENTGPELGPLKEALNQTADFFHFHLLHTDEGHFALHYLYERGIDLEFVKMFKVGFAPKNEALQVAFFKEKRFTQDMLRDTGLMKQRPFFSNRITFPILDNSGNVIGFSARKIHEETFGGKYINTPETPLFKKSKILFGLYYSRRRIAKDRKAIVVEGQIDALRLIQEGFNYTVAGQGTAFGEAHVDGLIKLGVNQVFLAFDGDNAGREAAAKVGHLFQKEGIEVSHLLFPEGNDPDLVLKKEGPDGFRRYLEGSIDHISLLVKYFSQEFKIETPAGKNQLARKIASLIHEWKHSLMVHEALKKLAQLLNVPETMIETRAEPVAAKREPEKKPAINPDRILETDLLRWLFLTSQNQPQIPKIVFNNLKAQDFLDPGCQKIFSLYLENKTLDLLTLASSIEQELFQQILEKKVNTARAKEGIVATVQKILERNWKIKMEMIKNKMVGKKGSYDELELAKEIQRPPIVKIDETNIL